MGIIISAFIGIGKEELLSTYGNDIKMLDLDVKSMIDEVPPNSFVDTISSQVNDYDIVFIPTSKNIRQELENRNIDYDIYYPSKERRQELILKFVGGRMPFTDIATFDTNCNKYIDDIDADESPNCYKHKLSQDGQFLWNDQIIIRYIQSVIENAKHSERVEESSRSGEDNETHEEGNA
jgi:hypothetical protein